jgi:pantetheine-phosphate adenylyltransferase
MIEMRFRRICLGGTFSPIHSGHRSLLERAFSSAEVISIGLTSDALACRSRARRVDPFPIRLERLMEVCEGYAAMFCNSFEVREIGDHIGFALEPDIDSIVVSEETAHGAKTINDLRAKAGLPLLSVQVVPIVKDDRGEKISSTRLQARTAKGGA